MQRTVSAAATSSAICTVLSAAPLRRLSLLTNSASPRSSSTPGSWRSRPTYDGSLPAACSGVGMSDSSTPGAPASSSRARATGIGARELGVDRQRVAGEDRHPHADAGDLQVGDAEDLARLVAELLLLVGLVAARRRRSSRPAAARCRRSSGRTSPARGTRPPRRRRPARAPCRRRPATWAASSSTPATPEPETAWYVDAISRTSPASSCSGLSTGIAAIVVQFGLAMMPLRASRDRVGVDLGDDQRDVGVHPERRGVVDDDHAGLGERRGQRPRGGGAGGEQRDVEPGRVGGRGVLDDDLAAGEGQHGAGRAGGGEEADLVGGELPLREDLAHGDADLAGGADDADA